MLFKSFSKFLTQEILFAPCLEIKAQDQDDQSQPATRVALDQRGADESQQNTGINRMADPAVQTFANQFMALFQGHHAAPVCSRLKRAQMLMPTPTAASRIPVQSTKDVR